LGWWLTLLLLHLLLNLRSSLRRQDDGCRLRLRLVWRPGLILHLMLHMRMHRGLAGHRKARDTSG
jgi:hypothetical protein